MTLWPRLKKRSSPSSGDRVGSSQKEKNSAASKEQEQKGRVQKRRAGGGRGNPYATTEHDEYETVREEFQAERAKFAAEKGVPVSVVRYISRESKGWVYLSLNVAGAAEESTSPSPSATSPLHPLQKLPKGRSSSEEFSLPPPALPLSRTEAGGMGDGEGGSRGESLFLKEASSTIARNPDSRVKQGSGQPGLKSGSGGGYEERARVCRGGDAVMKMTRTLAVWFVKVLVFSRVLGATSGFAVIVGCWNRSNGTFRRVFSGLASLVVSTLKPYGLPLMQESNLNPSGSSSGVSSDAASASSSSSSSRPAAVAPRVALPHLPSLPFLSESALGARERARRLNEMSASVPLRESSDEEELRRARRNSSFAFPVVGGGKDSGHEVGSARFGEAISQSGGDDKDPQQILSPGSRIRRESLPPAIEIPRANSKEDLVKSPIVGSSPSHSSLRSKFFKGSTFSFRKSGDYSSDVKSGDFSSDVKSGDYSSHVKSGDYSSHVKSGDFSSHVKSGDYSSHVKSGDYSSDVVAAAAGLPGSPTSSGSGSSSGSEATSSGSSSGSEAPANPPGESKHRGKKGVPRAGASKKSGRGEDEAEELQQEASRTGKFGRKGDGKSHEFPFFRSSAAKKKESHHHHGGEEEDVFPSSVDSTIGTGKSVSRSQELKSALRSIGRRRGSRSHELTPSSAPESSSISQKIEALPSATIAGLNSLAFPFKDAPPQPEQNSSSVTSSSKRSRRICSLHRKHSTKGAAVELGDEKSGSSVGASRTGGHSDGLTSPLSPKKRSSTTSTLSKLFPAHSGGDSKPKLRKSESVKHRATVEKSKVAADPRRARTIVIRSTAPPLPTQMGELGRSAFIDGEMLGAMLLFAILGFLLLGRIPAILGTACFCLFLSHGQRFVVQMLSSREKELYLSTRKADVDRVRKASATSAAWQTFPASGGQEKAGGLQSSEYRKKVLIDGLLDRGNH